MFLRVKYYTIKFLAKSYYFVFIYSIFISINKEYILFRTKLILKSFFIHSATAVVLHWPLLIHDQIPLSGGLLYRTKSSPTLYAILYFSTWPVRYVEEGHTRVSSVSVLFAHCSGAGNCQHRAAPSDAHHTCTRCAHVMAVRSNVRDIWACCWHECLHHLIYVQ